MKDYPITAVTDELEVLNAARSNLMTMTGCWIDIRLSAEKPKRNQEGYPLSFDFDNRPDEDN